MRVFFFVLLALPCLAALNVHPVSRTQIRRDDSAIVYADKMSDGTFRESRFMLPPAVQYPEWIELVATNETPAAWELVYASHLPGGDVATNHQTVVKTDAADRLAGRQKFSPPPVPEPRKADALALARARARQPAPPKQPPEVKEFRRMAETDTIRIDGGEVVRTVGGKEVSRTALRAAKTARVAVAPQPRHDDGTVPPAPSGAAVGGAGAAGLVAGAAAAAALLRRK